MREVQVGDGKVLRLKGSPLSLLYYQQEFGRDLLGDLAGMLTGLVGAQALAVGKVDATKLNFSALDSVAILRLVWTLARTDVGPAGKFPGFEAWLAENEDLNIFDVDLLQAVFEEVQQAFFRPGKTVAPAAQGKRV